MAETKQESVENGALTDSPTKVKSDAALNGTLIPKDEEDIKEEDDDEENRDEDEDNEEDQEALSQTLYIKISGFKRDNMNNKKKLNGLLYKLFTDEIKVAEMPMFGRLNRWVVVEMRSKEDKDLALAKIGKSFEFVEDQKLFAIPIAKSDTAMKPNTPELLAKAVESLHMYRKVPYKEELTTKFTNIKTTVAQCVENAVVQLKKHNSKAVTYYEKPTHVDRMVPMTPFYGYSTDLILPMIQEENGDVMIGVRSLVALNPAKRAKKSFLVPLDESIHIAPPLLKLAHDFTDEFKTWGVRAFNPITRSGDVAGLFLQMNKCGEIILTVLMCKDLQRERLYELIVSDEEFKESDDNKAATFTAEDPTIIFEDELKNGFVSNTDKEIYLKHIEEMTPLLTKYFNDKAGVLGVASVYLNWTKFNPFLRDTQRTRHYHHVAGKTVIKEELNNVFFEICPYRHWSPRSPALPQIIGVLTDVLHLDKTSSIVIASDYRYLTLYFAEKCKSVISINMWPYNKKPSWLSNRHASHVEIIRNKQSAVSGLAKALEKSPATKSVIVWGSIRGQLLKKLMNSGVKQVAFVFMTNDLVRNLKSNIVLLGNRLHLSKVYPIDAMPRCGLVAVVALFTENSNIGKGLLAGKRKMDMPMDGGKRSRRMGMGPGDALPSLRAGWERGAPRSLVGPGRWGDGRGSADRYGSGGGYYDDRWVRGNDYQSPPVAPVAPAPDPAITNTLSQLGTFMKNQMMFNEMLKVGIQRISTDGPGGNAGPAPPLVPPKPNSPLNRNDVSGSSYSGRNENWSSSRNRDDSYYARDRSDNIERGVGGGGGGMGGGSGNNYRYSNNFERRQDSWSRRVSDPDDKFARNSNSRNTEYWD